VVEYLIENGANVEAKDFTSCTPLWIACFEGHFEIVKVLVKHGASPHTISSISKHTPLSISVTQGHKKIVKFLKKI